LAVNHGRANRATCRAHLLIENKAAFRSSR